MTNDQPGPTFENIWRGTIQFSPDGKRMAYFAFRGGKKLLVVDGQVVSDGTNDVGTPVFSPDSKHIAFVTYQDKNRFVVFDGVAGPSYDHIATKLVFSADGKHRAYLADKAGKRFLVLDGNPVNEFPSIPSPRAPLAPCLFTGRTTDRLPENQPRRVRRPHRRGRRSTRAPVCRQLTPGLQPG